METEPETVHQLAETNLVNLLSSEDGRTSLSHTLSVKLSTKLKVTNACTGSIKVDIILEDLSSLEYMKELSDNLVLSNIMEMVLMTPEFIESCHAEDVALKAVLDEESYQRFKNLTGELIVDLSRVGNTTRITVSSL